jgi:hypothetical protein
MIWHEAIATDHAVRSYINAQAFQKEIIIPFIEKKILSSIGMIINMVMTPWQHLFKIINILKLNMRF